MQKGRIALVTGAGRGIGKAIAKRLAAAGCYVIVNYNGSREAAEQAVEEIRAEGGEAEAFQCNVASYEEAEAMINAIVEQHGGIDILLTHAPARNINDGEDLPHRGFETFCHLLNRYQPRYFIHGHVHKNYGGDFHRYDRYKSTEIINAYEYCIFDYEDCRL